jgi:hypothetical protein
MIIRCNFGHNVHPNHHIIDADVAHRRIFLLSFYDGCHGADSCIMTIHLHTIIFLHHCTFPKMTITFYRHLTGEVLCILHDSSRCSTFHFSVLGQTQFRLTALRYPASVRHHVATVVSRCPSRFRGIIIAIGNRMSTSSFCYV